MRLAHLKITKFKGLADVEVDFSPASVLIGPNDAGKSMILDAIRFLFAQTDRFGRDFHPGELREAKVVGTFVDLTADEREDWREWLDDGALRLGNRITHYPEPEGPMIVASWEGGGGRTGHPFLRFDETTEGWFMPRVDVPPDDEEDRPPTYIDALPGALPLLVMLPGPEVGPPDVVQILRPLLESSFERAYFAAEGLDDLLYGVATDALNPIREAIDRAAPRYGAQLAGAYVGSPFLAHSYGAASKLRDAVIADLRLWAVRDRSRFNPTDETLMPQGSDALEAAGAGTQRAMALAAIELYSDRDLLPEESSVILAVEEPEVGLHASAQRRVADAIAKISTFGVQTIVVTHSPILIDAAPLSGVRIVRRSAGTWDSPREVVTPRALEEIASTVGATPADVLLGDRFLIVEGKSDAAILTTWARRRGWDLDASKVKIYAAGSWTKAHGLASFVEVSYQGAKFFVVLDGGRETARDADEMRARFGERVDVTVLKRTEIEAYFTLEAIVRWLAVQDPGTANAESFVAELLEEHGPRKRTMKDLAARFLGRDYDVILDGAAIAGWMHEQDVPDQVVELFMKVTAR